jgi:hypothetical protein
MEEKVLILLDCNGVLAHREGHPIGGIEEDAYLAKRAKPFYYKRKGIDEFILNLMVCTLQLHFTSPFSPDVLSLYDVSSLHCTRTMGLRLEYIARSASTTSRPSWRLSLRTTAVSTTWPSTIKYGTSDQSPSVPCVLEFIIVQGMMYKTSTNVFSTWRGVLLVHQFLANEEWRR